MCACKSVFVYVCVYVYSSLGRQAHGVGGGGLGACVWAEVEAWEGADWLGREERETSTTQGYLQRGCLCCCSQATGMY